jgi:hypothetical protein
MKKLFVIVAALTLLGVSCNKSTNQPQPASSTDGSANVLKTYTNKYFNYQIQYRPPIDVQPVLGDFYGVSEDGQTTLDAEPIIEVAGPETRIAAYIEVVRNRQNLSPKQWAELTVKYDKSNIVRNERSYTVQGREAYSLEVEGGVKNSPEQKNGEGYATLDGFDQLIFIKDGDRMFRLSYPYSDYTDCDTCQLYPEVFSTFQFTK